MSMVGGVMTVDVSHQLHVVLVLLVKLQLVAVAEVVAERGQHHIVGVQAAYNMNKTIIESDRALANRWRTFLKGAGAILKKQYLVFKAFCTHLTFHILTFGL